MRMTETEAWKTTRSDCLFIRQMFHSNSKQKMRMTKMLRLSHISKVNK